MQDIFNQLENDPNSNLKEVIEDELKEAYVGICELRKKSLNNTLTIEYINEIENIFLINKDKFSELEVKNKYLIKYASCIENFWNSYSYYNKQRSRGKFDLFKSLRERDLEIKGYSDSECAKILRSMEDYWVSSNQIYTKHVIVLINKTYLR
ncbi:hypothetical protein GCM10022393_43540 [Aquimarina addita]|uniref:Uncharacterized protein n=1 Tax=Aquimarina addita TaxID=870485 RepID=A0ABP6UWW0_9FLAO